MIEQKRKISRFSESLEKKSVGEIPPTQTIRPVVQYPTGPKEIKKK